MRQCSYRISCKMFVFQTMSLIWFVKKASSTFEKDIYKLQSIQNPRGFININNYWAFFNPFQHKDRHLNYRYHNKIKNARRT